VGSQDFTIGPACFATRGFGLNCLGEGGWTGLTTDNSQLRSDFIYALAVCPDGTLLIAHDRGIQIFDGRSFVRSIPSWGEESGTSVACDPAGAVSIGYSDGVSRLENGAWRRLDSSSLLPQDETDPSINIKDITIDSQGALWVVADFISTDGSVGRFDGSEWTVYRESEDLLPEIDLQSIAIDHAGRVWVADDEGLFAFEGGRWQRQSLEGVTGITDLFVDTDDRIWFAYGAGLGWIKAGEWNLYELDPNLGFPDHANAIWVDGRGRIWFSTDYGAAIFDEQGWTSYHMHTSGLTANNLTALAVVAGGPELPPLASESSGNVSGRFLLAGQPLQNGEVELCVIPPPFIFYGSSPCAFQPYAPGTRTDAEGHFSFTVPPGHYFLTFMDQEGDWTRLTAGFAGMAPYRIVVEPEGQTELEDIKLGE
jgi:ligand-binding sensor domain-containing protein